MSSTTSNHSAVTFFNAVVSNDTTLISKASNEEDMNLETGFSNTFNAPIIDKQNNYDLSICRLVIPSDTIDISMSRVIILMIIK